MSLVDYDDSSSDDEGLATAKEEKKALPQPQQKPSPIQSAPLPNRQRSLNKQEGSDELPKLPDALSLLESPSLAHVSGGGNDHASVVAAAMAESALRKRDLKGNSTSLHPRHPKLPRGNLPHSKNIPETMGNVLVPPQLKGRSNVATEDISRLFVKKRQESSKATTSPNKD